MYLERLIAIGSMQKKASPVSGLAKALSRFGSKLQAYGDKQMVNGIDRAVKKFDTGIWAVNPNKLYGLHSGPAIGQVMSATGSGMNRLGKLLQDIQARRAAVASAR